MYYASPNSGDRYYLDLLLTVVKGLTSFRIYVHRMAFYMTHSRQHVLSWDFLKMIKNGMII
ncbi:hypothetical protein GIB67_038163 [Kingdonia uniflora]|uniref:Uncharacterized protein n=1 Tax=Kingdonia uniflora TaxID=39325 RepID=A0A7J7NEK7_9MAGN|nr:hypothetical protein GIB67_038163 [Kingdonia uniflora]